MADEFSGNELSVDPSRFTGNEPSGDKAFQKAQIGSLMRKEGLSYEEARSRVLTMQEEPEDTEPIEAVSQDTAPMPKAESEANNYRDLDQLTDDEATLYFSAMGPIEKVYSEKNGVPASKMFVRERRDVARTDPQGNVIKGPEYVAYLADNFGMTPTKKEYQGNPGEWTLLKAMDSIVKSDREITPDTQTRLAAAINSASAQLQSASV